MALTDESIIHFGKHKGKKLAEVPDSYLVYLYDNGVTGELKKYIEESVPLIQAQLRARSKHARRNDHDDQKSQ